MSPRKVQAAPIEEIAAAARAARGRRKAAAAKESIAAGALTFRAFLESRDYFPDPLNLSPAMWAIVDASDGRPDLVPADICRTIFNCEPDALPKTAPRVVGVGAGGRAGKSSRLLAPKALHAALTVPLPTVLPGEVVFVPLLANNKTNAVGLLGYIKGFVANSTVLRAMEVRDGPPAENPEDVGNAGSVRLRRHDGVIIDIAVRAAARAGGTVRGKTLPAFVLDEACFLYADDGHAVNDQDLYNAANQRVVPGGQLWIASTPWIDGEGLLERLVAENWTTGRQGTTALVAARVGTRTLNPTWDPDGSIERDMRAQDGGDINADREILAIPLPKGSRCFFLPDDVAAAMTIPVPDGAPEAIAAGADYGHTSDRSAVAVAERYPSGMFSVSFVAGIPSSTDRRPSETYRDVATAAKLRGARAVASDGHYKEAAREEYDRHGVAFQLAATTDALFEAGRAVLRERRLSMSRLPEADRAMLARQLGAVLTIPASGGRMKIHVPRATVKDAAQGKGTTHCDELVAVLTAVYEAGAGDPSLWANVEEKRAQEAAAAEQTWTPQPGSLASLNAYRNGGRTSTGRYW